MKSLFVTAALVAAACHPPASSTEAAKVAAGATPVGVAAPSATLHAADGSAVALAEVWPAHKQTVVVFYRGFY